MPRPSSLRPVGVSQDRQKRLLTALLDAGEAGLSRAQMAKLFGGQVRAVERSIAALQTNGATIETAFPADGTREKRFVLVRPPDDMALSTPEACLALRVAEESLRRSGGDNWLDLRPSKAPAHDSELGPKASQRLARATERVVVRGTSLSSAGLDAAILLALTKAMSEPFPPRLELAYRAAGQQTDRIHQVVAHAVLQDAFAGGPYLIAWDTAHQRPAIYRVSRMAAVRTVGHGGLSEAARKALAQTAQHLVGAWGAAEEPMRVRVHVTDARWAQHFLDATPDLPEVAVEPDPENPDSVVVTFLATALEGATRWILQLGSAAEVLEPPMVREAVLQDLERAAQRYRKPAVPSTQVRSARR